jgi:lysophospholipase L1-like esterase
MTQAQPSHAASPVARRDFLKSCSLAAGAAGLAGLSSALPGQAAEPVRRPPGGLIAPNDVILFQGDSITDAGWKREQGDAPSQQAGLGSGYAWIAAAALLTDRPKDGLKIYNRGISGHKVPDLAKRWQRDCLDLNPNVLSILIGVNDIWHTRNGNYDGTVAIYEQGYGALVERTRKALPQVRLVICEPFVLRCGAVNYKWFPEFDEYRAAARRVAKASGATFVPFQSMFDTALQFAPPEHWARDGVHPSSAGAALMAHTWLKAVIGP